MPESFFSPYESVEDTIETSGDNIGRVKDVDLAHEIANNANGINVTEDQHAPGHESRETTEARDAMIEDGTRIALAERAMHKQLSYSTKSMARQIVKKGELVDQEHWNDVAIHQFTYGAPGRAKETLDAYDSVTQQARRQNRRKD